jgi:uncharacterized UBP type Zn finger protein
MSQKQLTRQLSNVDLEEFRALVKTLVPTTLKQAEWICDTAEKLLHEHPELRKKLEEWEASDEEKEEAERIIAAVVARANSERKQSQNEKSRQERVKKRTKKRTPDRQTSREAESYPRPPRKNST